MLRVVVCSLTCLFMACGAPPASAPLPQPTPQPAEEHAGHGARAAHDLHAQEHEVAGEMAQPVEDHRARNHHRHHRF